MRVVWRNRCALRVAVLSAAVVSQVFDLAIAQQPPVAQQPGGQWHTFGQPELLATPGVQSNTVPPTFAVPASAAPPSAPAFYTSPPVLHGNTCRMSLDEVRQRALTSNKALTLARLNITSKQFATDAATKDYFPKVMGNVTYLHFDSPLGSVLTTRGVLLPSTINANVLNQDTTFTTALIAQPITKLIAVNAEVQSSRADESIAQAKLDQGAKQVLSGVTQAYYGLVGAQRIQAALEMQVAILSQAVAAHPSPELRIHLVELRQGALQVRGQVRDLNDQFNDLLDLPPGTVLELADPVPPVPSIVTADDAAAMAMQSNAEVREAFQNVVKAEAELKIARMAYLPDVNVIGGYANQTGASYIQPNFGYLGVTGSYTFFEWGKKVDVSNKSRTDISLARQNLQVTSDKVRLEARKSFGAFQQALETYRLAAEMVQACQDAERATTDAVSQATAKGATAKAQLDYLKAETNYRIAHAQLTAAIGCQ